MKQLSIVVPIFKVEKYVHHCLESIFRQGMDDKTFEVILINDGTPDKSMEVVADIIKAHQNIRVIEQENQGLSMVRNNGIVHATGEYIMFLDGDDLLINNSLLFLINMAISSKADLIVADFIKMTDEQIAQFPNKPFKQKDGISEEKTGEEFLLNDHSPYSCHVWRTLYRKDFLIQKRLRFIPNICFEDIPFTYQCYLNANRCIKVNWQYVIYRKGQRSITSSFDKKKAMDFCMAISKIWDYSHHENLSYQIREKIRNNTFIHFSLLMYSLTSCTSISKSEKMDVLYYMKELIPDLSFRNGIKQNIVNILYHKMPSTYMTLRIIYANYLQVLFWTIGDTIRNKDTIRNLKKRKHDSTIYHCSGI